MASNAACNEEQTESEEPAKKFIDISALTKRLRASPTQVEVRDTLLIVM